MIAGRMKYRITLLRPVATVTDFGSETTEYVETATVWAERARSTGRRVEEVGEHFPDHEVVFNIRDAHEVDENWRIQELGGHLYTVVAITPNRDRGYLILSCARVNE